MTAPTAPGATDPGRTAPGATEGATVLNLSRRARQPRNVRWTCDGSTFQPLSEGSQ